MNLTPQLLLNMFILITVCLYIAIRHTDIPFVIYMVYAFTCVFVGLWITVISLYVADVRIESEGVIANLRTGNYLVNTGLTPDERLGILKRSRAHRLLRVSVGQYSDYTVDVLVGLWDEILNQLIFLLTL